MIDSTSHGNMSPAVKIEPKSEPTELPAKAEEKPVDLHCKTEVDRAPSLSPF